MVGCYESSVTEPLKIVVTGCKGCPFAHYQFEMPEGQNSHCAHPGAPQEFDANGIDPFTLTFMYGTTSTPPLPDWCPLKARPVLVTLG